MTKRNANGNANVLLIDTDVLCYAIAFGNQSNVDWDDDGEISSYVTEEKAILQVTEFINDLIRDVKGTEVVLVLSEYPGFRQELDETYKANRKSEKPVLWKAIRDFIEWGDHNWPVESWYRLEGDDVLGILHTSPEYEGRSTIVTIDKDLNTIPGRCYFWNHAEFGTMEISEHEAVHFHLTQVLTGDQVDNYKGLKGVGPVKAEQIINIDMTPLEMWGAIVAAYESKGFTEADAIHQARLAYILRHGDYDHETNKVELWNPTRLI